LNKGRKNKISFDKIGNRSFYLPLAKLSFKKLVILTFWCNFLKHLPYNFLNRQNKIVADSYPSKQISKSTPSHTFPTLPFRLQIRFAAKTIFTKKQSYTVRHAFTAVQIFHHVHLRKPP